MNDNERMMYNAHLTNNNNLLNDIVLRQLCCHPALVSTNSNTTISESSLEDIQAEINGMYLEKYNNCKNNTILQMDKIKTFHNRVS